MILNFGANYLQEYKVNAVSKQEHLNKVDKYLQKFMHILEMKTGAANISQNIVSEVIVLNETMSIQSLNQTGEGDVLNDSNQKLWFQLEVDGKIHNFAAISASSQEHKAIYAKWLQCLSRT